MKKETSEPYEVHSDPCISARGQLLRTKLASSSFWKSKKSKTYGLNSSSCWRWQRAGRKNSCNVTVIKLLFCPSSPLPYQAIGGGLLSVNLQFIRKAFYFRAVLKSSGSAEYFCIYLPLQCGDIGTYPRYCCSYQNWQALKDYGKVIIIWI